MVVVAAVIFCPPSRFQRIIPTLTTTPSILFSLCYNHNIGPDGGVALANALRDNDSVQHLMLEGGTVVIVVVFLPNCTLLM